VRAPSVELRSARTVAIDRRKWLVTPSTAAREARFRGEPAIELVAGGVTAVFVPGVGMTGVSLRDGAGEYLALPGGLDGLRAGHTGGLPLLAPWANRLATRRYRAAGVAVGLEGLDLPVDGNGLPIHGFLVGRPGWTIEGMRARGDTARLTASLAVDAPAFPFPHRITIVASVRDSTLRVDTTVAPTGRRNVPIAFGWHPYLRLPAGPRRTWLLRLPLRQHLALDDRGIPTGGAVREPAEREVVGRRTFDDGYALGRDRRLAIESEEGPSLEIRGRSNYPYAQVWVPGGRPFVAFEPMTAPTNALVAGDTPVVRRGDTFTASFALTLGHRH
jgi:aldose 1-epimerase